MCDNEFQVPDYMHSTITMLKCAFPDEPQPEEYLALLRVLAERMSIRSVAEAALLTFKVDDAVAYNDVLRVLSTDVPTETAMEAVKKKLLQCGFEEWLKE